MIPNNISFQIINNFDRILPSILLFTNIVFKMSLASEAPKMKTERTVKLRLLVAPAKRKAIAST